MNFPFICSNIPAAPAYGVYISQLIRYPRACGSYPDLLDRGLLLTRKLLNQGFLVITLMSSLRKCYGRSPWLDWPLRNICVTDDHGYAPLVVSTLRSFPIACFVTRVTRRVSLVEQDMLTPLEHLSSQWGSWCSIFSFCVMFCGSLFGLLSFFFWPLCFLSFFDLWIQILSLVYSNYSYKYHVVFTLIEDV